METTCLSTSVEFGASNLLLKIWDDCQRHIGVRAASLLSGCYSYKWDASKLASGVYLYRLQAADYVETRRVVVMR